MVSDPNLIRNGLACLMFYPPFLQRELVKDRVFRDSLGLEVGGDIIFDHGAASFDRETFCTAVAAAYASPDIEVTVADTKCANWLLTCGDNANLRLECRETRYQLKGMPMLMADAADRAAALARMSHDAGYTLDRFATWRSIIRERLLSAAEIEELDGELARSPLAVALQIATEIKAGTGTASTIAPSFRENYAAFAGAYPIDDVAAFRDNVLPAIIRDWLSWNVTEGAKMALLSCSHATFHADAQLTGLPPDQLIALAEWASTEADLLSKVAMIELGLATLPEAPGLVAPLTALVAEFRDMDVTAAGARIHLLMGAYILVEGELARNRVLADFSPFQRRIAALAQASLFERIVWGHIGPEHFSHWSLDHCGRRFFLQTLIDLRSEPRWDPNGATVERIDADLVGRIRNAATTYAAHIQDPVLRELLLGTGPTSIAGRVRFPASFLPGPIEGAPERDRAPPPEFDEILDRTLESQHLTAHSVIALINVSAMFSVENERVDRAVALIRKASFHFVDDTPETERNYLIQGLAKVAARTRRPDLAGDVRTMLRRLRVDGASQLPASQEFLTCLEAAAAHASRDEWAGFVGDCAFELALEVNDQTEADILLADLKRLCIYEPALRSCAGKAIAALNALLGH